MILAELGSGGTESATPQPANLTLLNPTSVSPAFGMPNNAFSSSSSGSRRFHVLRRWHRAIFLAVLQSKFLLGSAMTNSAMNQGRHAVQLADRQFRISLPAHRQEQVAHRRQNQVASTLR